MRNYFSIKNILLLSLLLGLSFAAPSATAYSDQSKPDYTVIMAEGLEKPVEKLEENIRYVWPQAAGRKVDQKEPEAQKTIKELDIKTLPFVYFREGFESEKEFFLLAKRGILDKKGKFYVITDEAARSFGALQLDAESVPGRLEVFCMSLCPYGQQALKQIIGRIRNEGLKIDLKVRYITNFRKYGIDSLHGDDEIDEDIRQLIIQKYHPDKFFDYLLARQSATFEKAAQSSSLDVKAISDKKEEGRRLLEEDAGKAKALGISASPTFLFEGRYLYVGLDDIPLAQAQDNKGEASVGSGKKVEVILVYNPACMECRKVKNELMPEINTKYSSSINITYYDTSQQDSYNKMIELELTNGVQEKGKIPQVYLYPGGHVLIGEPAIKSDLEAMIKKIIQDGK